MFEKNIFFWDSFASANSGSVEGKWLKLMKSVPLIASLVWCERRSGQIDDRLFEKRIRDFSPKELGRLSTLLSRTPDCSDCRPTGTSEKDQGIPSPSFPQCLFQVLFQIFHVFDSN